LSVSVLNGSFAMTRSFAAPPGRVFDAFADLSLRRRCFRIPGAEDRHELDFRVGGGEVSRGRVATEQIEYRSRFVDVVANERIVFAYELSLDGRLRTISLVTIELAGGPSETRVTHTEQYVLLGFSGDGRDDVAHLEAGVRLLFNGLRPIVESP
jgi:uncharacterized protein YndB with AHSA1/START domain